MVDIIEIAETLLNVKIDTLLKRVLNRSDVQDFIVKLNTEDQLDDKNINAFGVKLYTIGGEYSVQYAKAKNVGRKQINLLDTGEYHETFAVVVITGTEIEIVSDNTIYGSKTDLARERWGEVEGLTQENIKRAEEFITEKFFEELERLL